VQAATEQNVLKDFSNSSGKMLLTFVSREVGPRWEKFSTRIFTPEELMV
jgi:hypothetical protein